MGWVPKKGAAGTPLRTMYFIQNLNLDKLFLKLKSRRIYLKL